jgi:uncharacterized protein (DUF2062 family)
MLVAFLPLVGFQTAISIGLAALARANKAVCVPIVWITNPVTLVPIYGGCLALGRMVMATQITDADAEAIASIQKHGESVRIFEWQFWRDLFHFLGSLGVELWVGCFIVGLFFAIVSYVGTVQGVVFYRERRRVKLLRRSMYRAQLKQARPKQAKAPVQSP